MAANYCVHKRMIFTLYVICVIVLRVSCAPSQDPSHISGNKLENKTNKPFRRARFAGGFDGFDFPEETVIYDQRQNGSENFRLNVDGVAIVVAPPETLLQALPSLIDFGAIEEFLSLDDAPGIHNSPESSAALPGKPTETGKPDKPAIEILNPDVPSDVVAGNSSQAGQEVEKISTTTAKTDVNKVSESHEQLKPNNQLRTASKPKRKGLRVRLANLLIPLLRRTKQ